tara:strand:+ start:6874 stop:7527 length:654 start_codon:yes stop_codon:yes gene_type:complete
MIFPHPFHADDDGLLAYGGDLSPSTLLAAYSWGIFPWYSQPPILWWFTHPRCILRPSKVKVSKSMRSYFNQKRFKTTTDTCFEQVINECSRVKRKNQETTWISEDMINAYIELHHIGHAHSIEVWEEDLLVGGLYGIAIGNIFFGESMFSTASNASKFGLITLCRFLEEKEFLLIDCQQETDHIMSLGAEIIPKEEFLHTLKKNMEISVDTSSWKWK